MPMCLSHNPNWVYFFDVTNYLWYDYVTKNIPQLSSLDSEVGIDVSTREDILLRASRIGWTFADNFSANWSEDDKAERFLKRFISSWIPYVRSYDGTPSMAAYISYLLGMEIRIEQLWSNTKSDWDGKPVYKLFNQDTGQLPDDFMVMTDTEDPFSSVGREEHESLHTVASLTNNIPNWQCITEDPVNGWYPTSHFDLYVDLDLMPKSDVPEKTAEDIITGLFYELADLDMVLRAIVYTNSFAEIVRISSAGAIVNRIGNNEG